MADDAAARVGAHHYHYYGPGPYAAGPYAPSPYAAGPYASGPAGAFGAGFPQPGAAAAYLLTNEKAQRAIMRAGVLAWAKLQGGVEELKERLHDAEAEVAASAAPQEPEPAASDAPPPAPKPLVVEG